LNNPATGTPSPSADNRLSVVRREFLLPVAIAFIALALLAPFLSLGLHPDGANFDGAGSVLRQASYVIIALALFVVLKPHENYHRVLAIPLPLLIGIGYCWLSVTWAIDPMISFRRIALMSMIVWMIFAMMRQLKFEEVVLVLRWALVAVLIANYAAVILMPDFGMHTGNKFDNLSLIGDWRGILEQKNIAGAACAITIILFTFERRGMPRWFQFGVIAAAAYFLYRSNSKTSVAMCGAALVAGFIFLRYRLRHKGLVLGLLTVAAIAVSVLNAVYYNPLIENLNDPKALTGRTKIWKVLLDFIGDHPLFGSGYGSFWNIGPSSPVFKYASDEVTLMAYGHNGFLDMAAQLGIPGFILIVFVTILLPFRGFLSGSPLVSGQKGALLVALFLFCVGYNFTETALYYPDSFVFVMLLITIGLSQPSLINFKREKFDVHARLRILSTSQRPAGAGRTSTPTGSPSVRRRR
jgi:O-antigen ligase